MSKTYYKQIDGKNYDKDMLEVVKKAKPASTDGKPVIGIKLAEKLFNALADGKEYTSIEKKTMKYIRDNYLFTPEADNYIRKEVRRFAAIHSISVKPEKKIPVENIEESHFEEHYDDAPDYRGLVDYKQDNSIEEESSDRKKNKMIRIGLIVLLILLFIGITWLICRPKNNPSSNLEDSKKSSGYKENNEFRNNSKIQNIEKPNSLPNKSQSHSENKLSDATKNNDNGPSHTEFSREPLHAAPVVRKDFNINSRKSSISYVNHLQVPFIRNAEDITSEGKVALNELADVLKKHKDLIVRIEGHTCWIGDLESNVKLSKARAKIVYDYLLAQGVSNAGLESRGYGETESIADNSTQSGRMKNRRVEFTVIEIK